MELTGEQIIKANRDTVFAALNDPDILKEAIPGCESLEKTSDNGFNAVVGLRVGPVTAKFNGSVTLENLNPPESYTLVGEGKGGAAGFAKGKADVVLEPDADGTLLKYTVKADLGGKIAQLGARLMQSTANKLSGEFFGKFAELVEAESASPTQDMEIQPAQQPPKPETSLAGPSHGFPLWAWVLVGIAAIVLAWVILG